MPHALRMTLGLIRSVLVLPGYVGSTPPHAVPLDSSESPSTMSTVYGGDVAQLGLALARADLSVRSQHRFWQPRCEWGLGAPRKPSDSLGNARA